MTKIIDHKTLLTNLVLIPRSSINIGSLNNNDIKNKLIDIYGETCKPVVAQFPDLLLIFDPANQIEFSIIGEAEQNKISINDKKVTNYSSRELNKLSQLAKAAEEIILDEDQEISAYGFNILSLVDSSEKNSSRFILNSFINNEKIKDSIKPVGGGVRLIYNKRHRGSNSVNDLRIDPHFDEKKLFSSKTIHISQNSHFISKRLPGLSGLDKQITKIYDDLPMLITNLLE